MKLKIDEGNYLKQIYKLYLTQLYNYFRRFVIASKAVLPKLCPFKTNIVL